MLIIDENMYRLAKMQETLLKVSNANKEENLKKYIETVLQIDTKAYSDILEEIKHINEHNQSLEKELEFLDKIKKAYDQLLELQSGFKNICQLYGNNDLKLSDLSRLNIEYIEDRINIISGYLINKKNIKDNERRLGKLNEELIDQEKQKNLLSKRLKELESELRDNFINAEGRVIVGGQLQYVSVISEYKELGYDFKHLLSDYDTLDKLLSRVNADRIDTEEKLRTAEICYENAPSIDSKQIYDEIDREYLRVKYRLTMLKILELLSKSYNQYDMFKKKREDLIDLIKYRFSCLEKLGVRISIDPFGRTRVSEQFDVVSSLKDNSRDIDRIKKEIVDLNQRLEEMVSQNSIYMATIRDTKNLVSSRTGTSDIDITEVTWDVDEYFEEKVFSDNQVTSVRNIPKQFNMGIVSQKTNHVIRRVYEMVNTGSLKKDSKSTVLSPELVIVQKPVVTSENKESLFGFEQVDDSTSMDEILDEVSIEKKSVEKLNFPVLETDSTSNEVDDTIDEVVEQEEENAMFEKIDDDKVQQEVESYDSDIFMTVDPFLETPLFTDRVDDVEVKVGDSSKVVDEDRDNNIQIEKLKEVTNDVSSDLDDMIKLEDEMPDAFWIVQGENDIVEEDNSNENDGIVLSFDEQIKLLRLGEDDVETNSSKNKSKILKFNNDVDRKVA